MDKLILQFRLGLFSALLLFGVLFLNAHPAKATSYGLTVFDYSVQGGFVLGSHETYLDYNDRQYYYASVDGWLLNYGNDETLQNYQTLDYQYQDAYGDAFVQTYAPITRGKIYATYSRHLVIARYTYNNYYQDPYGFSNSFQETRQPTYNFNYGNPSYTTYQYIPVAATAVFVWLPNITGLSVSTANTGATREVEVFGKYIGEHSNINPVVMVSGSAVTVGVKRIVPGEGVVLNVQVADDAAPGERQLSLQSGTYPRLVPSNTVPFNVTNNPPNLTSIDVASALPGTSVPTSLRGSNLFGQNQSVSVDGTGVTATIRANQQPNEIELLDITLEIADNASRGDHNITLTVNGRTSNAIVFRVGDRSPIITGISQQQGQNGEVLGVIITGQHFGLNPQILIDGGGIGTAVNVQSPTEINVTFAIGETAPPGERGVKVKSLGISGMGFQQTPGASDTSNSVPFNILASADIDLPNIGSVENQAIREFTVTARNTNGSQSHLTIENPSNTADGQGGFAGGENEIVLNGDETKTVRIKGLVRSKNNNNIKLKATYGNNKHKEKAFSVSWVEFLKKGDCDGFDDRETTRSNPIPAAMNYLLVGQNVTRQARARIRPDNATGEFRLESAVPNTFTVTPGTINTTSSVDISVAASSTAAIDNYDLRAISTQQGTTEAASAMTVLVRPRKQLKVVQWKIIEDNDDVQDTPEGQGSPNKVAFILLPGPNGIIDSVASGDDTLAIVLRNLDVPPEYRRVYRQLRRDLTGPDGITDTLVSGDDIIYVPPAGASQSSFTYDPDEPYAPFIPLEVGNGVPYGTCVSAGANRKLDTLKSGDDVESTDSLRNPVINSGANGRCQTEANHTDIPSPNSIPSASELENYLNNEVWGKQANIFIDVERIVQEKEVNFDLDRDGKIKSHRESYDELSALYINNFATPNAINLYYTGMLYKPLTSNPLEHANATSAIGGTWGIYASDGLTKEIGAHEIGHNFGANHRQTLNPDGTLNLTDWSEYVMFPRTRPASVTQCRTGKQDWDEVQKKPTP